MTNQEAALFIPPTTTDRQRQSSIFSSLAVDNFLLIFPLSSNRPPFELPLKQHYANHAILIFSGHTTRARLLGWLLMAFHI